MFLPCSDDTAHTATLGRVNRIDHTAEENFAAQAMALTSQPLVGMVLSGADEAHTARIWQRHAPRRYYPLHAESVRVVGDQFATTFNPNLAPAPRH